MGSGDRALKRRPRAGRPTALSALALAWALGGCTARAAEVDVQVLDARGQPLAGAVVFLESAAAAKAARPGPLVEISQAQRRFDPDVTVITTGTPVSFPNRDTVRHHVYSFSETKRFEIKLYVGTPAQPVVFDRSGVAVLGCNIHDTMQAWVLVVDTPWHARTGAGGRARLQDVPPGTYQLRAWHSALPPGAAAALQPLTLTEVATATVRVQLAEARP